MAIYAIGDIQGCFEPLQRLLEKIAFNPAHDRLWFTGDLVNRGPQSLETLRFVIGLGTAAITVLGNHDLHLLAVAYQGASLKKKDTLAPILDAPDRLNLLEWLRHRPLLHFDDPFTLIHAGLPPQWDFELAHRYAVEVESVLRGPDAVLFFEKMYGNSPQRWSDQLTGWPRLRFITNAFTRMRFCDRRGTLDMENKGPPGTQPEHLMPWFEVPGRKSSTMRIIFGHWSTLGFRTDNGIYSLDTGCLWGGELTALRLGTSPERISVPSAE